MDSPHGHVNDLETMARARATLHFKDKGSCCNAVIDSISVGTPVLIDSETLKTLGAEDYLVHMVSGIVVENADDAAEWIQRLHGDDMFLEELCYRTREFARLKLKITSDDVARFREFIAKTLAIGTDWELDWVSQAYIGVDPVTRIVPKKVPAWHLGRTGDSFVLMHAKGGESYRLNASAAVVWELCDGESSVADIQARIATAYGAGGERRRA
jgi:hypothetical protein